MLATKENTTQTVNNALNGDFGFIHTGDIQMTLNGSFLAKWLESCGFNVVSFRDTGRCGLVELDNGVFVSTNGFTYTK